MSDDPKQSGRRLERSSCDINAKIELSDRLAIVCIVKDLSSTGAKIVVAAAIYLPDEFDLLVPVAAGTDQRFRVKQLWRKEDVLGGEFVSRTHVAS